MVAQFSAPASRYRPDGSFDRIVVDLDGIASLIETCKLNAVDPLTYLTATLTAIINGHKQSQIEELLPWHHLSYGISSGTHCR